MSADWFYQIHGVDLGPVPLTELRRLTVKGRVTHETMVRRGEGSWIRAEKVRDLFPAEHTPWTVRLLARPAAIGVPIGMALLPWGRVTACVGLLVLSPFVLAAIRLLLELASDVRAMRRKLSA